MRYYKENYLMSVIVESQNEALASFCWNIVNRMVDNIRSDDFDREGGRVEVSMVMEMSPVGISPPVKVRLVGLKEEVGHIVRALTDKGLVITARSYKSKVDHHRNRHPYIPTTTVSGEGIFGECRVRGIDIDELLRREALRELGEDW